MNRNSVEEFLKEEARRIRQEEAEFRENPLMQYKYIPAESRIA